VSSKDRLLGKEIGISWAAKRCRSGWRPPLRHRRTALVAPSVLANRSPSSRHAVASYAPQISGRRTSIYARTMLREIQGIMPVKKYRQPSLDEWTVRRLVEWREKMTLHVFRSAARFASAKANANQRARTGVSVPPIVVQCLEGPSLGAFGVNFRTTNSSRILPAAAAPVSINAVSNVSPTPVSFAG